MTYRIGQLNNSDVYESTKWNESQHIQKNRPTGSSDLSCTWNLTYIMWWQWNKWRRYNKWSFLVTKLSLRGPGHWFHWSGLTAASSCSWSARPQGLIWSTMRLLWRRQRLAYKSTCLPQSFPPEHFQSIPPAVGTAREVVWEHSPLLKWPSVSRWSLLALEHSGVGIGMPPTTSS